jgi:hypothetical protein
MSGVTPHFTAIAEVFRRVVAGEAGNTGKAGNIGNAGSIEDTGNTGNIGNAGRQPDSIAKLRAVCLHDWLRQRHGNHPLGTAGRQEQQRKNGYVD